MPRTVMVTIQINGFPVHYIADRCRATRGEHGSNTCADPRCFRCFGEDAYPCTASGCAHQTIVTVDDD